MILGRLRRENTMGPLDPSTPPPPQPTMVDLKMLGQLLDMSDAERKKFLTDYRKEREAFEKARVEAKAEQQKLAEAQRKYEEDFAAATAKHHADLDKRDAASLARDDSRSKALAARETAVHQRELEAERLAANARAAHDAVRKQIDAFDRAATLRV
jgi:septal ring factor EnvC (AmiA/AmiB activator)